MAKYYYNGVLLPEIPSDVLTEYPYCLIRQSGSTYDFLCGKYPWYCNGNLYTTTSTYVWYTATLESESLTYKTSYTDNGNFGLNNGLVWANHDVKQGSDSSSIIYFFRSEPTLVQESNKYYYNDILLPEIPQSLISEFPYCWIRHDGESQYKFLCSKYPWYYNGLMYTTSSTHVLYDATLESYQLVYAVQYNDDGRYPVNLGAVWANHDIPNGSATSTDIYLYGSEAEPEFGPKGYRKLEYIEASGTQYIDTGIPSTSDVDYELEYMGVEAKKSYQCIIGSPGYYNSFYPYCNGRFDYVAYCYDKTEFRTLSSNLQNVKCSIKKTDNVFELSYDDSVITMTASSSASFTRTDSMLLFTMKPSVDDYAYARLYSCKIYNGTELVRDFIPVLDADDVVCLYDKVTETYFYNQGSGSFTAGPLAEHITNGEAAFTIEAVQYVTSALSSSIKWVETTPEGTSVKVSARLSDGDFTECVNGEAIPCIDEGMDLSNSALEIKVELATEDPAVTPTFTGLMVMIQNEGDDHIIVLEMGIGNTTNIQNAIGEVNVAYAGGSLIGEGGMVPNFSMSFLPENLAYEGHQNDVEHVDVDIDADLTIVRVYHRDRYQPENVSVAIDVVSSLIHVDDI